MQLSPITFDPSPVLTALPICYFSRFNPSIIYLATSTSVYLSAWKHTIPLCITHVLLCPHMYQWRMIWVITKRSFYFCSFEKKVPYFCYDQFFAISDWIFQLDYFSVHFFLIFALNSPGLSV
jgi:hypothetical protein